VISEIVRGKKEITPETAVQLAAALGTSAEFWSDLEANYRLRLAKRLGPAPEIVERQQLYLKAPLAELIRRGWLANVRSTSDLATELCRFLRIDHLGDTPLLPVVNLRVSATAEPELTSLQAWLKRAESLAQQETVRRPFDPAGLGDMVSELRTNAADAERVASVPPILSKYGVRFVLVPHLPKTYLDGAHFSVGTDPAIALTFRFDRIDHFWFTLFHEIAHLQRGDDGRLDSLWGQHEESVDPIEEQTNDQAGAWLIDPEAYENFLSNSALEPSLADITAFAREIGVHPGIVLGRLQHKGLVPWEHHRSTLAPVKQYLDAWIDRPIDVTSSAA
jgi:HTH-type transcriptional regulator/antitoxin HigA